VISVPSRLRDRLVGLLPRPISVDDFTPLILRFGPDGVGTARTPLRDPSPDPGIFGPDSLTWRVMREPLLILGGGRALLMQAADPLVAQAAIDHSAYATDPFGRLERTIHWVTVVTFGTTAEAKAACRLVNRLHRRVSGRLPTGHATRRVRGRSPYSAMDEELLLWVHATFVDTMLATHDALIGGLSDADRDRFVREWHAVARLMRVPHRLLWRDHAQMRDYIDRRIASGRIAPGAGSRLVSRTIMRPPLVSPALRPMWDLVAFTTVGLLPAQVRRGYGILWTPAHDAAHTALRLWLRSSKAVLPRRLRVSPVYDLAMARVTGRMRVRARAA